AWHEEGKNKDIWKKLRLIVVHSAEVYIPLNLNQSPFNVGIPISLPMFTLQQVQDLAKRYNINWSLKQLQKLMDLVGGNPYLLKLALYHISLEKVTLDELLIADNHAISNIYLDHLQRQLWAVKQQNTGLLKALEKVVLTSQPIELDLVESIKLQSLGLVHFQGHKVIISCRLYQQYFQQHFQGLA
ncbi:MAG: AAA-like domain-containing protein, partial [Crocosphaera sp.]